MKVKHLLVLLLLAGVSLVVIIFPRGHLYVKATDMTTESKGFQLLYSIKGSGAYRLTRPSFAVADDRGRVYIADSGNQRGLVFSQTGRMLFQFGDAKSAMPLVYPYGIGLLDSSIIVADPGAGAIREYDQAGKYLRTWLGPEARVLPGQISVSGNQEVYVTDMAGKQILVFSPGGKLVRRVKPAEIGLGLPQGVAVNDDDNSIWVVDSENYNVKLLSPQGKLLLLFDGGPEWALSAPKGLAVDKTKGVYVSDALTNSVRLFDFKGGEITQQDSLRQPAGLSVDKKGRLYIADQGNDCIQVWTWK
ncbi:MAG TPA: hypothetical protein VHS59_10390 [Bacillota bacterium]|nr:hypothetical protein [Bacillota bacterium]